MNISPREATEQAFDMVLEQFAFMFSEPLDQDDECLANDGLRHVTITFQGEFQGQLTLAMTARLCQEMTANILGIDPDEEGAQSKADDALCELLNITCGHVLTSLAGDQPAFDLSIPEVQIMSKAAWRAMRNEPDTIAVSVEGQLAMLRLQLEVLRS